MSLAIRTSIVYPHGCRKKYCRRLMKLVLGDSDDIWATRFTVFYWLLWKQRCNTIFGNVVLQGMTLVKYGDQIATGFAVAHTCRYKMKTTQRVPW
ncbi:hypothetical protein V6N11_068179 [Hibiscus sabdariffa]|uniref:Uncharacterized protein n=1 Tax=Hibiscus sabdariffa TaxID=183260 RepID=A0ABR2STX7_9ROSI